MFIIGYLLTISVCITLICVMQFKLNNKILICALLFGLFAFFIVPRPDSNVDALKYFQILNHLKTIPNQAIVEKWNYVNATQLPVSQNSVSDTLSLNSTPVMGIIMMIVSMLPNSFLLALAAFCDYFFTFKMMGIILKRDHLSSYYFGYGFLVFSCLFVYSAAVGGIRNNLVGTIFGYFVLRYFAKNGSKFNWSDFMVVLIIALFLSLIHPFTLILLVLFVLTAVFSRLKIIRLFDVLVTGESLFQPILIKFFSLFSVIPFFASIVSKSGQYLGKNATIHISSSANLLRDIMRLIVLLALFIIIQEAGRQFIIKGYSEFLILLFCLLIGSVRDQLLFDRILLVLLPIMSTYFILLLEVIAEFGLSKLTFKKFSIYSFFILMNCYALFCLVDNLRAGELYYQFLLNF